jgi:CHASE2 domain-containing sensor protein
VAKIRPANRARNGKRRVVSGQLLKLLLVPVVSAGAVSFCATQTRLGADLSELSYATTQHRLARSASTEPLSVAVIDVSGLPRNTTATANADAGCYRFRNCVTDRDSLLALIGAVIAASPRAVGIDIDFSPDDAGWIDPARDPWFLAELRKLREQAEIPIHVTVGRGSASGPDHWLGSPEFALLGAGASRSPDNPRAPFTMWQTSSMAGVRLCSMAAALTSQCEAGPERGLWARLFPTARSFEHCTRERVCQSGEEFYVDYSRLPEIEAESYSAWRPEQVAARNVRDKIVLIGYAASHAPIDDRVPVPGRHADVAGVFALAAATQTLIDGQLRLPGTFAGITLDIVFALFVLGAAQLAVRRSNARRKALQLDRERLATAQQLAWPLVFGALAFLFVAQTRIVWSDFLISVPILIGFLWLDPRLEVIAGWLSRVGARVLGIRPLPGRTVRS